MEPITVHVGTRKSQLALIQTYHVISKLKDNQSGELVNYEVVEMSTVGDEILDRPLPAIGEKSLFTRELETSILNGDIEFAVHSLKDLPTVLPDGCTIGAVIKRDCPEDALVLSTSIASRMASSDILFNENSAKGLRLKIGSSSKRRIAMLKRCNPNLECIDIRGNLNTRFKKLDHEDSQYAGIILASAGLTRMGWSSRESKLLVPGEGVELADWFHAVGQGAIAVECRQGDLRTLKLLETIIDIRTTYEVTAERSLMRKLEAGCSVPLGVRSSWSSCAGGEILRLEAIVLSDDGREVIKANGEVTIGDNIAEYDISETEAESKSGIATQSARMSTSLVKCNLVKAANLGEEIGEKMIGMGCMNLL